MNSAMCVIRFNKSDSLAHYGIKGQKHGLRRFQNEDGSYTEEGKRRYGIGDGEQRRSDGDATSAKEQRSAKIKKALAIVGGIAAAAVLGYGIYKGTGVLKQRYIAQAKKFADHHKKMALSEIKESRMTRDLASSIERTTGRGGNDPYSSYRRAFNLSNRQLFGARSHYVDYKNYTNLANNATRGKALKNWVKNNRKIDLNREAYRWEPDLIRKKIRV